MQSIAGLREISEKASDAYDRPARLNPGLLLLSPIAILIVCLYGQEKTLMWGAVAIAASCGGAYALCRIVRSAGQRLQSGLFDKWGGAPTTQLLRHSNEHFDVHTKERFHKALSKAIGKKMPTATMEADDPQAADELYRAAALWLINQTRDTKKSPLVFKENIAFGFQRNALGIRIFGSAVAGACLVWCFAFVGGQNGWTLREISNMPAPAFLSMLYSILLLMAWIFVFTEASLRRTGFSYAERLIQSLDLIKSSARVSVKKGGR